MNRTFKLLKSKYNSPEYLGTDPISLVHNYSSPEDREVVALIVSLYSYGNVQSILQFLRKLLEPLGKNPYTFLIDTKDIHSRLNGRIGAYRFQKEEDSMEFLRGLGTLLQKDPDRRPLWEDTFLLEEEREFTDQELKDGKGILSFQRKFRKEFQRESYGLNFLVGKGIATSPHKRYSMFLRWMVGREYPDLGIYSKYPLRSLVLPMDTHITNMIDILGFDTVRSNSRKKAIQFTEELSSALGEPAILYDFALSRIGIFERCKKRYIPNICSDCDLKAHCRYYSPSSR